MPSEFPDFPAPDRGPRHSADAVRRSFGDAAWAGDAADTTGRHRRPESLADHTRLRSVSAVPHETLRHTADRSTRGTSGRRRSSRPRNNQRGKHIKQADPLALTVRSIPAVIDAAGAVRDWAMDTGTQPPVTGSHRAPGTLPIESWLLVGKHRQQALLATLVAAGLALVMIPMQQSPGINPVNAADHGFASAQAGQKSRTKTPGTTKPAGAADKPGGDKTAPVAPAPAASSSAASSQSAEPAIAVPQGTGPAKSLRTTGSDTVALTFDDGPDPVQTPKILALLAQYQIKATFCLIGENVQKHPEIVREIVAAGHTLCNHTWNHSLTIGKDKPAAIRADLEKTNAAIRAAVPGAQIPFFRAPGGNFTDRLVSVAYGEQMTSLYWQVDPRDWDHTTDDDDTTHTDRVISTVQKTVKPGSIILSHDFNQPDTISAYQKLLPYLTENFQIGLPVPPPTAPASAAAGPPPADPAAPPPAPAGN